jgi:hypothetical protein
MKECFSPWCFTSFFRCFSMSELTPCNAIGLPHAEPIASTPLEAALTVVVKGIARDVAALGFANKMWRDYGRQSKLMGSAIIIFDGEPS